MKKTFTSVIFAGVAFLGFSQQMPQYSQYLRNQYMVNPAAAGVYDFVDITMSARWQWAGFSDSPKTAYASATAVLGKKHKEIYNPSLRTSMGPVRNPEIRTGKLKHAIGGQFVADQYGAFQRINLAGTYALHIPMSRKVNLAFGAKVGMTNNSFLQNRAVPLTPSADNTYQTFIGNQSGRYCMDLGAGLYLYSKHFFVGVSADQLTRDMVEFGSGTANYDENIHYMATAGIKIPLNDNLTLTPAVLVKYMHPSPVAIEGTLQLEYKEWLWFGGSYRHGDAVVGMVGMNISHRLKLGYSFDFATTRYSTYRAGGHELVLGLMLGR